MRKEKATDQIIIIEYWNAIFEDGESKKIEEFELRIMNTSGEALVDFCRRLKKMVVNTWYEHEKRRRYTWKRPGDTGRFHIDYILAKHRYRNSVKNSRSYPRADAKTDHNLVMAKIKLKLKKLQRSKK